MLWQDKIKCLKSYYDRRRLHRDRAAHLPSLTPHNP